MWKVLAETPHIDCRKLKEAATGAGRKDQEQQGGHHAPLLREKTCERGKSQLTQEIDEQDKKVLQRDFGFREKDVEAKIKEADLSEAEYKQSQNLAEAIKE